MNKQKKKCLCCNSTAWTVYIAFLMFSTLGSLVLAAEEVNVPNSSKSAAVVIDGTTLAVYRTSLYGISPQERADVSKKRIESILKKPDIGQIKTQARQEGTSVLVGDDFALLISEGDLDLIAQETMEQAVEFAANSLKLVLEERQQMRSVSFWAEASLRILVATVVFVGVMISLIWGMRRIRSYLIRWETRALGKMRIKNTNITQNLLEITRWTTRIVLLLVGYKLTLLWLVYCFCTIPVTRAFGEHLQSYGAGDIQSLGEGIANAIPGLFIVTVIIFITYLFNRLIKVFFLSIEEKKLSVHWMPPEVARPTSNLVVVFLWLFAFVAAYEYIPGSSTAAFKGIGVFLGVILSLGSTNVLGQIAAGYTLMYSRAYTAGEYVQIGDVEGTVVSVGYLATKIRTQLFEEVNIPNAVLLTTSSRNLSRTLEKRGMLLRTCISIGYSSPWRQVEDLLQQAASQTSGLRAEPKPFVCQVELGDFYAVYELNVFLESPERKRRVLSILHSNIQDTFNLAGLQIMSPHYVADPAEKVWVPQEKWHIPTQEKEDDSTPLDTSQDEIKDM